LIFTLSGLSYVSSHVLHLLPSFCAALIIPFVGDILECIVTNLQVFSGCCWSGTGLTYGAVRIGREMGEAMEIPGIKLFKLEEMMKTAPGRRLTRK
jgi:hypothetical protein